MKPASTTRAALLAAAGASLLIAPAAHADYVGIEACWSPVTITDTHFNMTGEARVWRLYVVVDSPLDIVPTVFGNAANPLSISSYGPGGDFFQHEFGGLKEPGLALVGAFPELAYDSFVTIGSLVSNEPWQPPTTTQGDLAFGPSTLSANNGAWFRTPDSPLVHATAVPLSTGLGVLIAQLTLPLDAYPEGIINLVVNTDTFVGQTFAIPAPGALPLLGLAALVARGGRRRGQTAPCESGADQRR